MINNSQYINNSKISPVSENNSQSIDYARSSFFSIKGVNGCKDWALHERLQTLIKNAGLSNQEFYRIVGISRQHYYQFSWGLQECPIELKVKIARTLNTDSSLIWQNSNSHGNYDVINRELLPYQKKPCENIQNSSEVSQ